MAQHLELETRAACKTIDAPGSAGILPAYSRAMPSRQGCLRSQEVYATRFSSSVFSSTLSLNILPSSQSCFPVQTPLLNSTQCTLRSERKVYERVKILNVFDSCLACDRIGVKVR